MVAQLGTYPFGESWYNATNDKLLFTSYERDAESGNDYAMARSYVNRLGRFSALDPMGGSAGDPQSLNAYTYTLNDPMNFIDPLGLTGRNPQYVPGLDPGAFNAWLEEAYFTFAATELDSTPTGSDVSAGIVGQQPTETVTFFNDWIDWLPGYVGAYNIANFSADGNPSGGNSSWLGTFAKTFVSNLVSPTFYKQEFAQGGCLNTFLEGVDQADVLGPVLNGSPGFAETAIKGTAATVAANYAATQGLTVPLRSSIVRGILGAGETGAAYFAPVYLEYQGLFGVIKEAHAAATGECH